MAKHNTNTAQQPASTQPATQAAQQPAQAPASTQPATPVAAPTASAAVQAAIAAALQAHATAPASRAAVPYVAHSTVARPVQLVHTLCAKVLQAAPNTPRSQLVALCVQHGVATATAQTQVGVWLRTARALQAQAAQQQAAQ